VIAMRTTGYVLINFRLCQASQHTKERREIKVFNPGVRSFNALGVRHPLADHAMDCLTQQRKIWPQLVSSLTDKMDEVRSNKEVVAALSDPKTSARFAELGSEPLTGAN
jgi:hypothetical protein